MTISQLVDSGVQLGGGDESLHPLIKRLLSAWIKNQVGVFPYIKSIFRDKPASETQNSLNSGVQYIDMPTDYFETTSLVLFDADGSQVAPPLVSLSVEQWDDMRKDVEGSPYAYWADHENSRIYLYPTPNANYTYYHRYRKLPDEIDAVGSSDDSKEANELNTGFPDQLTLIRVCKAFTLEWRNMVQEAALEWGHVREDLMNAKRGNFNAQRRCRGIRLNSTVFKSNPYGD